jgi:hypothetical protein
VDVGAQLSRSSTLPRVATRLAAAPLAIAAIVTLSSLLQTLLAWRRPTPGYLPDEYMYAELGRSLLDSGAPLVREESAHFLPLVYPLLTAPAWLWDDVDHAYRTIQALNAVSMSLAAIPVFLLARRLGVGDRLAVAAAALAVMLPELLYSSAVMAETVAYPLAIAAAAVGVAAIERPTLRLQLAFLALSGLATFTRLQLAVLPLCYLAAVVTGGLRDRRLRAKVCEHWLVATATGAAVAVGAGVSLFGSVGIYGDVTAYTVEPLTASKGLGATALVLAYGAGWVIVPGALIGLALALVRPRSRAELGFAAFTLAELVLLLLQSSVVGDSGRAQERYAMYVLPLLLISFVLYASRGWPHLRTQVLLAGVAATTAAMFPLAGHAAGGGSNQSLVLVALRELERRVGDVGIASLALAAGATILSALVLATARVRPPLATSAALAVTAVVALAGTGAAFTFQHDSRELLRAAYLPADPSWVDNAGGGTATLLVAPRSTREDLLSTLFWNRTVRRLALLAGADRTDAFAALEPAVDGAGRLDLRPGLLLTDRHGSTVLLRDAERVGSAQTKTLWRTTRRPQLQLLLVGRYFSGLMAADGGIRVWPRAPGGRLAARLELRLSAAGTSPVPFEVDVDGGRSVELTVEPGRPQLVSIPVCGRGVWNAGYASGSVALAHGTRVGVRSSEPRLVDDPAVCP